MADVGTLIMKVSANTTDFDKKMTRVTDSVKKVGKIAAIGGAAVVGTTAALGKLASKAAETTDRVDKMSQKIGISRKAFQELDFITSQTGTNVEVLQTGVKRLTDAADEASRGTKLYAEAFDRLGVSVKNTDGSLKSQEDLLYDTINALQSVENETERAALASDLLGRSATELAPLLNAGAGEMEKMKQEASALGLVMSDDAVDAGVKFTDTMDQLKRSFTVVGAELGTALIPIFQRLAEFIIENMPKIKETFSTVFGVISEVVSGVWSFMSENFIPILQQLFGYVQENFPAIKETFTTVFGAIWGVVNSVWGLLEVSLIPVLKLLFGFIKDNSGTIKETFVSAFEGISTIIETVTDLFETLVGWIQKAYEWLTKFNEESRNSGGSIGGASFGSGSQDAFLGGSFITGQAPSTEPKINIENINVTSPAETVAALDSLDVELAARAAVE